MIRYNVHTTNIVSIGYDAESQLLEIAFKLKITYQYSSVPLSEYIALMKADDIEDFYLKHIKYNYHFTHYK